MMPHSEPPPPYDRRQQFGVGHGHPPRALEAVPAASKVLIESLCAKPDQELIRTALMTTCLSLDEERHRELLVAELYARGYRVESVTTSSEAERDPVIEAFAPHLSRYDLRAAVLWPGHEFVEPGLGAHQSLRQVGYLLAAAIERDDRFWSPIAEVLLPHVKRESSDTTLSEQSRLVVLFGVVESLESPRMISSIVNAVREHVSAQDPPRINPRMFYGPTLGMVVPRLITLALERAASVEDERLAAVALQGVSALERVAGAPITDFPWHLLPKTAQAFDPLAARELDSRFEVLCRLAQDGVLRDESEMEFLPLESPGLSAIHDVALLAVPSGTRAVQRLHESLHAVLDARDRSLFPFEERDTNSTYFPDDRPEVHLIPALARRLRSDPSQSLPSGLTELIVRYSRERAPHWKLVWELLCHLPKQDLRQTVVSCLADFNEQDSHSHLERSSRLYLVSAALDSHTLWSEISKILDDVELTHCVPAPPEEFCVLIEPGLNSAEVQRASEILKADDGLSAIDAIGEQRFASASTFAVLCSLLASATNLEGELRDSIISRIWDLTWPSCRSYGVDGVCAAPTLARRLLVAEESADRYSSAAVALRYRLRESNLSLVAPFYGVPRLYPHARGPLSRLA